MKLNNLFCHEESGNLKLYFLDIKEVDKELEDILDNHFIKICEGNVKTSLSRVKKRLLGYLDSKRGTTLEYGSIAEFFVHLLLNELGYKQECLYFNLEENSIKKGFDGYYSFSDEEWIMESKSGLISTQNISHESKIDESYKDLQSKFSGKVRNNPWNNAYNHASHIDVGTFKNIRDNIKSFSNDFTLEKYHDVKDFNIIPTSTIFLDGNWINFDKNELKKKILEKVSGFNFKKGVVICITKGTIDLIYNYLKK